jgi:hypothetical protein
MRISWVAIIANSTDEFYFGDKVIPNSELWQDKKLKT